MKLFKSFKHIEEDTVFINQLFKNHQEYLAHSPDETLIDHINLVKKYFNILIKRNNLEQIIENQILKISFQNDKIADFLKEMFFNTIIFHDYGKLNPNFQFQRMGNTDLFQVDNEIKIGHEHSFLSAYLFLNYYIDKISFSNVDRNDMLLLYPYSFIFCIPILKHHSGYLVKDYNFEDEKIKSIHQFVDLFGFKLTFTQLNNLINYEKSDQEQNLWTTFHKMTTKFNFDYFSLFTLLKLNFSLLTASDYYATSEYTNSTKFETEEDFGMLTKELKKQIISVFDNNVKKPYNGEIINETQKYLEWNIEELQIPNNSNLNILRQKMSAEIIDNIEKFHEKKLFYIEAPTGGGKTNMSLLAIRKLIELNTEINKIFYVFPFTTLITQTHKVIKDTFGLTNNEVIQLHSKAGYEVKSTGNEDDAIYGNEYKNQIDNIFVNYPFILLTHIKFFDILKSNKKDINYLLHRLANSIVVIDELQSYNPSEWDKLKYFISKYSELFKIRFILMSATLPRLDKIAIENENSIEFIDLIPNSQKKYLSNPNFAQRVKIKAELLDKNYELGDIAELVLEKSNFYSQNRDDEFRGSVFTIIEFIYKKSASEFYEQIHDYEEFFDEIFVLSGTILEFRRKYIIEFLKAKNNRKKKILLISTQVVEAGVDIDMDLGFKNTSLIDSDEQLAGRINRNVAKKNCELYLFNYDRPAFIYGKDFRYEVSKNFTNEFKQQILNTKNFEKLYDVVIDKIDKENKSIYKKNFNDYLSNFDNLDLNHVNKDFQLIKENNLSIFIPVNIPIQCYEKERNFSVNEIKFIAENSCFIDNNNNCVSGEKIWKFYKSVVENKEQTYFRKIKTLKILNSIMAQFTISIMLPNYSKITEYCEYNESSEDFKFLNYLKIRFDDLNDIYDINSGINHKNIDSSHLFL